MSDFILSQLSPERLVEILAELRAGFSQLLGNQLEAIYLYGSQARGDARPGSDIDVLIVVRGKLDYFELLERTSRFVADLSLQNDVVISRVFVSKQDFEKRQTPLIMNVHREGILV
ncbi:MAG: nucleotidyltransferase domain-containing protein [Anaerolineales bacterium]|nr:nucleotidyltransferase domain-containing protein [Anaerolineales bacterium]